MKFKSNTDATQTWWGGKRFRKDGKRNVSLGVKTWKTARVTRSERILKRRTRCGWKKKQVPEAYKFKHLRFYILNFSSTFCILLHYFYSHRIKKPLITQSLCSWSRAFPNILKILRTFFEICQKKWGRQNPKIQQQTLVMDFARWKIQNMRNVSGFRWNFLNTTRTSHWRLFLRWKAYNLFVCDRIYRKYLPYIRSIYEQKKECNFIIFSVLKSEKRALKLKDFATRRYKMLHLPAYKYIA